MCTRFHASIACSRMLLQQYYFVCLTSSFSSLLHYFHYHRNTLSFPPNQKAKQNLLAIDDIKDLLYACCMLKSPNHLEKHTEIFLGEMIRCLRYTLRIWEERWNKISKMLIIFKTGWWVLYYALYFRAFINFVLDYFINEL